MSVYVLGLKSGDTTAESHRFGLSVFMQPATGRTNRRSGIAPSPTCADLVAVSAMQAKVSAFIGWIDGTSSGVQAGYPFVSDGDVVLTFDPGEPSVARVDRVIARVLDSAYDSSGQQAGSVEVLKGDTATGAATALPPTSLLLWEVTVPAGASAGTGGIDFATARADRRTMTSALGGVVIVRDAADRDTMDPYEGLTVWRSDVKALQVYSDGFWRYPTILSVTGSGDRDGKVPEPRPGQLVFRTDLKTHEHWDGTAWRGPSVVSASSAADRNGKVPSPLPGQQVFRTDLKAHDYWDGTAWRSEGTWTNVTFQNGWGNWSGSWQSAQYRRDITGRVHVRGLISGGTSGNAAFTLPAGFRPPSSFAVVCISSAGNPPTVSRVIISSGGAVTPNWVCTDWVAMNFSFDTV